jgi:hypothetical protein
MSRVSNAVKNGSASCLYHPKENHGRYSSLPRRLQGSPFYNIVAADKRVRRDGAFIERLGFYNPSARGAEEGLRVALDRVTTGRALVLKLPTRLNA